jgi:hypothetical protein
LPALADRATSLSFLPNRKHRTVLPHTAVVPTLEAPRLLPRPYRLADLESYAAEVSFEEAARPTCNESPVTILEQTKPGL